jgi:hypothetical protein
MLTEERDPSVFDLCSNTIHKREDSAAATSQGSYQLDAHEAELGRASL